MAERLGDLPLALDLAGRFFKDNPGLTAGEYLAELAEGEGALAHTSLKDWVQGSRTGHATSLAATFLLSWEKLAGEGELEALARRLFLGCGYCAANTPIPPAVLEAGQKAEDKPARRRVGQALRRLYGLGLLAPGESGPSIHPLLAEYARLLDKEQGYPGLEGMADGLAQAAKTANESGLPDDFPPVAGSPGGAPPRWSRPPGQRQPPCFWNNLGYHYRMMAEYPAARAAYERALAIDEKVLGPDHPNVATLVNNLGRVLQDLGDLPGARAAFERALAIVESVLRA